MQVDEWWYAVEDQSRGPVTQDELKTLLPKRKIHAGTLVCTHGLDDWTPLGEVEELRGFVQSHPPTPQTRSYGRPLAELRRAGAWRRFFARQIDLLFLTQIVALGIVYPLSSYNPTLASWINVPGSIFLFGWIILIPLILVGEALIFACFGNTLGKALLRIVVTTRDARPVTPQQYVSRLTRVWWQGLGAGVPVVSLLTMLTQYVSLRKRGHAKYDAGAFTVRAHRLGTFRRVAIALLLVCMGLLVGTLNPSW